MLYILDNDQQLKLVTLSPDLELENMFENDLPIT